MKTAFLFPGQGAQVAGMGKDIAEAFDEAAAIFKKADDILGYNLSEICFAGPEEKLNTTAVSQPAIFVTSSAILEVLKTNPSTADLKPDITAGLSLGEYTALYAANVLTFQEAVTLVQERGNAMQAAADASKGGMVSILGLDEEKVNALCTEAAQGELLVGVNFNCPGQIVISGAIQACNRAVQLAEKYGAIKAIPLKVAGAFHTDMMAPAANALQQVLKKINITAPADIKVIANINAEYYTDAEQIVHGLIKQLIQPILWQKCMERLISDGVENFYEIGPKRVLTGLMKKINRKTKVINISNLQSVHSLL